MNTALNVNQLQNLIADDVKELLQLPDGSTVDVKFRAASTAQPREGEITIKFALPTKKQDGGLTGAPDKLDEDAILFVGALRDAWEKTKYPFISLSWFKRNYLPALGFKLTPPEMKDLITRLLARGEIIVEKLPNLNNPEYEVTAIRTPDMPSASDPRLS